MSGVGYCGHGVMLGAACFRCDAMRRAIEGEDDDRAPDPTREEVELRRESRWPAWLERSLRAQERR